MTLYQCENIQKRKASQYH